MRKHWLQRSGKNINDLEEALESIRRTEPSTSTMAQLIELGYQNQLVGDYENEGILLQAATEYEAMVSSREEVLGHDHFSTRRLRSIFVSILRTSGQLGKSAAIVAKEVEVTERDPDTDSRYLLDLKNKLATIYKDLGKLEDSETLMQEVLEKYPSELKKYETPWVVALFELSSISLERGRNEEAVQRGLVAVEESSLVFGPSHGNTLMAKSILAQGYAITGELEKAIKLNEEVARVREESFGADHPDTIETLDRLGLQYYKQGKYELSRDCYNRVVETRVPRLGRSALPTIRAINNYAATLTQLDRGQEAATMQEELLTELRTSLGVKHIQTINLMGNLGVTYQTQRLWDKAEPLERDVFCFRREESGEKHEYTLTAMRNLSDTLFSQGKWHEAAQLSLAELEVRQAVSFKPDQEKLTAIFKVTRSLARLEDWEATIHHVDRELALRTALGNNNHTEHLQTIALAATSCLKLQQWMTARSHVAAFLAASLIKSVEVNSTLVDTIHDLATLCEHRGLGEEAEQLFILEILTLQHFVPLENTTLRKRVEAVAKLKLRQGKPADSVIFNPSLIIERARKVAEERA